MLMDMHMFSCFAQLCLAVVLTDFLPLSVATTLSFDGTEYMKITLPQESRTEAEDITLRFRSRRPNGLIFATTSSDTSDRLELMLEDSQVRFDVNLGTGSKVSQWSSWLMRQWEGPQSMIA